MLPGEASHFRESHYRTYGYAIFLSFIHLIKQLSLLYYSSSLPVTMIGNSYSILAAGTVAFVDG